MKKFITTLFFIFAIFLFANSQEQYFEESFDTLKEMIDQPEKYSFKDAVFSVESAYNYGILDTAYLNYEIEFLKSLLHNLKTNRELKYQGRDKEVVEKYAALFTVMNDTIPLKRKGMNYLYIPFSYDFEDPFGQKDWNSMFVSKLLETKSGNCHSLPYLYKILAEEIGVTAHLALSPNHVYIKHRIEKEGWYNTELTSGIFPIDAWLMASGYIHLDAIVNGVYMKALENNESIALCLIDLAQAYEKRFPNHNGEFVLKCSNLALEQYPNFVNAHILKMEAKRKQLENILRDKDAEFPKDIMKYAETAKLFAEIEKKAIEVHKLGYRKMPEDMYLNWLVSLKEEREKFTNKNISTFNQN